MPDNAPGNPPGTDPGTRGLGTEGEDSYTVVIDATSDDGSHGDGDGRGLVGVGLESNADPDSPRNDAFSVDFGDIFGDADDDELPVGDADEHQLSFGATSGAYGELDVDLSPWAPLLGMLESTEPEASPGDRPFTTAEGVEAAHALELRAESMLQYAERGAQRTGELDRTEVGVSDDNRDVVAGRDEVEIDGMLEEHTGHGLVHVADDVEMNVGGRLRMHAHLEDNIIMAGVMRDEWKGGTVVTAAMSDDMAAGLGLRCTAPLDVWVHGLMGMEERPGTCAADGILLDLAGTLYEREYGPSAHVALVARHSGTVVTTMKTGFRPLMKTALGVRNLIPGGGGGGGAASASPPAAPPAPAGGAAGGEAAGAVTLTAVESGGALGRGVAGSDDTEDIVSVARTVDNASDAAEVEDLQRAATTADNLDDLARVEIEGTGYQQVAEIYEQPIPPSAVSEPEGDELSALVNQGESLQESSDLDGTGARPLADSDNPPPLAPEQPGADPSPGADSAAPGTAASKREPPPLDLTEPGTEGYDFRKSYGSLHDRNQFYRQEMNLRGNFFMREYLGEIDAKAFELFEKLGGSADEIAIDNYGLRTSSIYDTLEQMAEEAERAGDVDRLADIRTAMEEIEELVQSTLVEVAARTDEFSGAAIGSDTLPDVRFGRDKLDVAEDAVLKFRARTTLMSGTLTRRFLGGFIKAAPMEGVICGGALVRTIGGPSASLSPLSSGDVYGEAARVALARTRIGLLHYRATVGAAWSSVFYGRTADFVIEPLVSIRQTGPTSNVARKLARLSKMFGVVRMVCPLADIAAGVLGFVGGLGYGLFALIRNKVKGKPPPPATETVPRIRTTQRLIEPEMFSFILHL